MADSFNCASGDIYTKENFDKLFNRWCDISRALEAIVEEFGDNMTTWKLERKSAKKVMRLKDEINDALYSYIAREEFVANNPEGPADLDDQFSMFDLIAFLANPNNDIFKDEE